MANSDEIELEVDGKLYKGWKSVTLTRSLEALCGSFRLEITDPLDLQGKRSKFPVAEGAACRIRLGSDLYLSGFVDALEASIGRDEHSVTVEGRDKAQDLVDCSPVDLPLEFFDVSIFELAVELATPFGLGVVLQDGADEGDPFERFSLQVGETAHEALERACRLRGFLATSNPVGSIVLTRAGSERAFGEIVQGGPLLLSASLRLDVSQRFARYVARGQAPGSDLKNGAEAAEAIAEALDPFPRKARTFSLVVEGNVDDEQAKLRVDWEANVRAARGQALSVRLRGWREIDGGPLWAPNRIVSVSIPSLRVSGEWLVATVVLSRTLSAGTTAELGLVRADAYLPEPPRPEFDVDFGEDLEEGGS